VLGGLSPLSLILRLIRRRLRISVNGLEGVIIPVNAGLSSKPSGIYIEDVSFEDTFGTYHGPGECGMTIPAITLAGLIARYSISREAVLKIDCEGCEYDVMPNNYRNVKLFDKIAFEYHGGAIDRLLKVLVKDYNCSHVVEHGVVYCTRKHV